MASEITSLTIVYSTVNSGADQRKHQSSLVLAFVWGIHRWPANSPHKWPVTRKMFQFDDVIMKVTHFSRFIITSMEAGRNMFIYMCSIVYGREGFEFVIITKTASYMRLHISMTGLCAKCGNHERQRHLTMAWMNIYAHSTLWVVITHPCHRYMLWTDCGTCHRVPQSMPLPWKHIT